MSTCPVLPIFDPDFKADPFGFYDALRATPGPTRLVLPTGVRCWLVVDYATVRALIRDDRLSKDSRFAGQDWHATHINRSGGTSRPAFRHLLTMDPPRHTRLRALVMRDFQPSHVAACEPMVERIVSETLDGIDPTATVDLATEFSTVVPLLVICELLGVPVEQRGRYRRWAELLMSADADEQQLIMGAVEEMSAFLLDLAADKRRTPDGSLYSRLVQARTRGELTDAELVAMGFILLVAGHETTAGLLSTGVLALARTDGAWRMVVDHPEEIPRVVEELLRYCSPVEVSTPRFARSDMRVGDVTIGAGDTVFLALAAANWDPSQFTAPEVLDLDRAGRGHLAFGSGPHFCLGAGLARLEAVTALRVLARRYPRMVVVGDDRALQWAPGLLIRGLRTLPVRLRPAA